MYKHIVVKESVFEEFNRLKGKSHNDKLLGVMQFKQKEDTEQPMFKQKQIMEELTQELRELKQQVSRIIDGLNSANIKC